jgi:surface polysaccharide O-acyltransferase-like enzyme
MISGIFFLSVEKEMPINKILKHSLRLFTALLFWEVIYCSKNYAKEPSIIMNFKSILSKMVTAPSHFWFIPVLIGIYLLVPIIRLLAKNEMILKYYLIIWFIASIMKKTILILSPIICSHNLYRNGLIISFTNTFLNIELMSYTGYFILGYYLYNYFNKHIKLIYLILITLISQIICILINYYVTYYINGQKLWNSMQDYMSITTFIEAICLFLLFKDYLGKIVYNAKLKKIISYVSSCTFGIYLMHPLFTEILYVKLQTNNIILFLPLLTIGVFVICIAVSTIIKLIPIINKYIV